MLAAALRATLVDAGARSGPTPADAGKIRRTTRAMRAIAYEFTTRGASVAADERNQRRARLDFGTKLGMNSPF
ncbi:hypothetical protein MSG28_003929 [Choristoneura fumiferana]|uniref:Uncharacterized protein n=1 Tax=Choristoneura fumiferana TaxID=7141 RepID=A0ACC0KH29_CHOFU|nr:hypothetical protein MSG28_003929 [Choristoneura fumiferana]